LELPSRARSLVVKIFPYFTIAESGSQMFSPEEINALLYMMVVSTGTDDV